MVLWAGESYAGIYVPLLAHAILEENNHTHVAPIKLKGEEGIFLSDCRYINSCWLANVLRDYKDF